MIEAASLVIYLVMEVVVMCIADKQYCAGKDIECSRHEHVDYNIADGKTYYTWDDDSVNTVTGQKVHNGSNEAELVMGCKYALYYSVISAGVLVALNIIDRLYQSIKNFCNQDEINISADSLLGVCDGV